MLFPRGLYAATAMPYFLSANGLVFLLGTFSGIPSSLTILADQAAEDKDVLRFDSMPV
jgi:hypothetical protein